MLGIFEIVDGVGRAVGMVVKAVRVAAARMGVGQFGCVLDACIMIEGLLDVGNSRKF